MGEKVPFFENLNLEPVEVEPELSEVRAEELELEGIEVEEPSEKTPLKVSVHDILEVEGGGGRGEDYGKKSSFFCAEVRWIR